LLPLVGGRVELSVGAGLADLLGERDEVVA
jgi:hypothetical protein